MRDEIQGALVAPALWLCGWNPHSPSLLGWLHSVLLSRLGSLIFWGFQHVISITPVGLCAILSGTPCLASQAYLCSLSGGLHDSTLWFYIPVKSASVGDTRSAVTGSTVRSLWSMAAAVSERVGGEHGGVSPRELIPWELFSSRAPRNTLLKWNVYFCTLEPVMGRVFLIPKNQCICCP